MNSDNPQQADMSTEFYNHEWINIDGNYIHRTAIVHDCVKLGKGNTIGAYAVIGGNGEIRGVKQGNFKGFVIIGDNNVISELVTIQRPYTDTATQIGNNNIIMAHAHVGHDVQIGNDCEICSGAILGGYSKFDDGAKVKLGVTVRNRKVIGKNALLGLGSVVVKDVADDSIVYGNPAKEKKAINPEEHCGGSFSMKDSVPKLCVLVTCPHCKMKMDISKYTATPANAVCEHCNAHLVITSES